ncbi:TcmI family type II polyketide cyclase [Plantactinospora sp. S1510]|uniref:TcmI family type II polyketide cyclase n=1 Tax=Plantactinospora alkalitolerans TaxID=2789879 RepID=A0ABS0GTJ4_9ACTN|nr:TcmI family type II polyketide cyclase [Plantactinospora alkalitolerans]MBF9129374.1 TcmI family type II polyketide cyclase [Plantactinospora alkalitolerans]
MNRVLIVGRIVPGTEEEIAKIFTESDETDLHTVTGVRHRSLYQLGDLCLHLMETEEFSPARLEQANRHPLFASVTERLSTYISPYSPNWQSPRDAMARCFYQWDGPGSATGNPS